LLRWVCIASAHRPDAQRSALLALRALCRAFDLVWLLLLLARIGVASVPTFTTDRGHVLAVAADRLAALAACDACFGRTELMRIAGRMCCTPALGSDRALLGLVH
jgi:hypothetical protein